eukprot:scaffold1376_cov125-Cylindrotheca_fusiformis.AAC.18
MSEKVIQAALEYISSTHNNFESQADFLRRKGLYSRSHEIYFSTFMSATKPEWLNKARDARDNGLRVSDVPARTSHQRKIIKMAFRILEEQEMEQQQQQQQNQASRKRKAVSSNDNSSSSSSKKTTTNKNNNDYTDGDSDDDDSDNDDIVNAPSDDEITALQASIVSIQDDFQVMERQLKEATEQWTTERQRCLEWQQHKQDLQGQLLEQSKRLAEQQKVNQKLEKDNQRCRKELQKYKNNEDDDDDDILEKSQQYDREHESLQAEQNELEEELQIARDRLDRINTSSSSLSSSSSSQYHHPEEESCSQLEMKLESLKQLYQQTNDSLDLQMSLLQTERTRRMNLQRKLEENNEQQEETAQQRSDTTTVPVPF